MDPKLPYPQSYKYGNRIRHIYLAMAIILFGSRLLFPTKINFSAPFLILFVLILVIVAGFTNPRLRVVVIADLAVAVISFLTFGLQVFSSYTLTDPIFLWINGILALLSIFNVYYSVETVRDHFQMRDPFT